MSEFERVACKALGIILFCIIGLLILQLSGCTCNVPPPIEIEYIDKVDTSHLV